MPSTKTLESRCRKLIADLAAGCPMTEATELMVKINAVTLKIDRAGEPKLADQLMIAKREAYDLGRVAYRNSLADAVTEAKSKERESRAADPCAWMRR